MKDRTRTMHIPNKYFPLLSVLTLLMFILKISNQTETITTTQIIRDGETLVSSGGGFELGFFSPQNSNNRYVGMWYREIPETVVWVANRGIPLTNKSGILKVIEPGLLVLLNNTNGVIVWSSNTSRTVKTPVAKLLDSGNLVVKDENDDDQGNYLWESFNYPTDTLLPGMKLGWNFITGLEVYLSSWKSNEDPISGDFTYHCDPTGYPQNILKNGSVEKYRTGPWNGLSFSGTPNLKKNDIFKFELVLNKNEVYYHYELLKKSVITRFTLSPSGVCQRLTWTDQTNKWQPYLTAPTDICDPEGWKNADWSKGCVRRNQLNCQTGDVFLMYSGIKLPDTRYSRYHESMILKDCKVECLNNCSCTAYTYLDISRGGSGCLLWFGELIDIKELPGKGQDIYIRMASSELDSKGRKRVIEVVSFSLGMGMILLGLSMILYIRKRKKSNQRPRGGGLGHNFADNHSDESHNKDIELPLFDLYTITKATDNFSTNNKLGEGGFGPVYKGLLEDGQEVAVKRLSRIR